MVGGELSLEWNVVLRRIDGYEDVLLDVSFIWRMDGVGGDCC